MSFNPYVQSVTSQATIAELFEGYLAYLENKGAKSINHVKRVLGMVSDTLGASTPISMVTTDSICKILGKVYQEGSHAHAAWIRQLLMSVWRWGSRVVNDYRIKGAVNYGITSNPVQAIPSDNKSLTASRGRFFTIKELPAYLGFLQANLDHPAAGVLCVALLTGSRIEEIANLTVGDFDSEKGTIHFAKTKTGNAHTVGLGQWAKSILKEKTHGKTSNHFIFTGLRNTAKPISNNSIYVFFEKAGLKDACPRDSRRTVKTLAQVAGISRETLDLIQNHNDGSIASKHYDKFFATTEAVKVMQEALNRWEGYLLNTNRMQQVA